MFLFAFLLLAPLAGGQAQPAPERGVAVVEHAGDTLLRDRLIVSGEVWYDAGEFLVGRFPADVLADLAGRDIRCERVAVAEAEELLVVPSATLDGPGQRVLHRSGRQALVATTALRIAAYRLHGQGVVVPRAAMNSCPPAPSGRASLLTGDPRIQALVDQVDEQQVLATVQSLSAITSRRATTSGATTAQNLIVGWLQGVGLTTSLQNFGSQYSRNVFAEIPGVLHPERIVVLGAHYDSINSAGSSAPAPGADDNASGSGGVLEAARVLAAGGPYENTIRFALFSAEEFGLVGSDYAAQQSLSLGEQVVAMLNMDMIAYRASGDARDVDFATNNTSAALTAQCRQIGSTYVPGWASTSGTLTAGTSDHQSYFTRGFPAAFFFEDLTQYSPYIHTANDTHPQSTNDPQLARMVVQGVVASVATLAVPSCTQPSNYCIGAVNSTGFGATIGSMGSTSVVTNDLTLLAFGCPPGVNGLFIWGVGETQIPLGNGFLCAATNFRRLGLATTNVFGDALFAVDQLGYPGGPLVAPGDVRNAQFWYRDVPGGGALFNLSNALRLTFCP
jgi:leucyl aminopeptidase